LDLDSHPIKLEVQHGGMEELMQVTYTASLSAIWRSDFISRFGVSVGSEVWGLVEVI